MNKQELIDKLKKRLGMPSEIDGSQFDQGFEWATKCDIALITKLDEPEKTVVPQFVADFYESIKDDFENGVYELCIQLYNRDLNGRILFWFGCDDNKPIETLVLMHKFGYEVEKEKLYTVEIPNPNLNAHTILKKTDNGIILIGVTHARWRGWENSKLTESEIKEDFEWAFRWAKEVE